MKIIKKIVISKFRSFGENMEIECSDVNIFSGGNDSGKSNIIKAINLFFNERTDNFTRYNPENDFNKWFRDNNERGQRNIIIKIYFHAGSYSDPPGINNGFIAEKIYGIDGSITPKYYLNDHSAELTRDSLSYRRADAVIRGTIKYMYIPAIRDVDFRKYIQRELLQITNGGNSNLSAIFSSLKIELDNTFSEFGEHLKRTVNVNILSDVNFSTLLESMSFNTNEQIKITKRGRGAVEEEQNIPMLNRGDGIQMQFLSFLLWFIASKDKKHKYIWGFEEPEIAYEFKKQFDMATVFVDSFSKNTQIFLSTHSPAFVFNITTDSTKQYRVYKSKDTQKNRILSKVSDINQYIDDLFQSDNTHKEQLKQDIWGTNYQRLANTLGSILKETDDYKQIELQLQIVSDEAKQSKAIAQKREQEIDEIKRQLTDLYPNRIFICEDKNAIGVWEQLFEKTEIQGIKILSSKGCSNDAIESAIKFKQTERQGYNPKIFRQLDLDGYFNEQVTFIERRMKETYTMLSNYNVRFLPVNELENFAILSATDFSDLVVKSDSDNFDKIKDALIDTAKENLTKVRKRYLNNKDTEDIRNLFNNTEGKMRDSAKEFPCKLLPGKEICKIKKRFRAEKTLKSLHPDNFPIELTEYLDTVKVFFQ